MKPIRHALVLLSLLAAPLSAEHYRLFVLTGQSNSLGTTNGTEADLSPGSDPADTRVKFFWHNRADAATSLGDSGGVFTGLQAQQGGYYSGSSTHWGPEIGFARTLVRAGVENVAIVKASRGGGGNTNWSKSAGGHMYSHVVTTVNAAAQALQNDGHTFEIAGLLYLQGESDNAAEANLAGERFKDLADNLRADLPNATGMRAVIGGIAAAGTDRDTVRARHQAIADATPSIGFFPNLDLRTSVTDGLHFDKAAKLRIGERFAQAFFDSGTVSRHYGRLVFIGDSITQGGNGYPSYRYTVFKHLAQRGVPAEAATGYQFVGSVTGAISNNAGPTPDVNGESFANVHDGHFGWRASWINARVPLPADRRSMNRGEGTLLNWTGQASPQQYQISGPGQSVAYPDPAASGTGNTGTTYTPDTVSIMIGINDLGDNNNAANQVVADIATIIDQLRAANPNVRLFVNRLLYTHQTQAMKNAVDAVNAQLPALAATKNADSATSPVWVIDAGTGFDPVAMTYDNVHPNAAGETYVGDRIAAALGIIETPLASSAPPPHLEKTSSAFDSRYEGNEIWNGSGLVNQWTQTGTLTRSLPEPTDLRLVHPGADGRWIEGTNAGWSALASGSWTFETRLKGNANPNGFILWLGAGSRRVLVEVHGDRTRALGGGFETAHDNLDGNFHVFRIVHDAGNARYHVFRDDVRLSPIDGVGYDQTAADSRLILGDYTSASFGNQFDITLDHVRFTVGAWLPPGLDSDGNGLPDAWEYQHFGTLTGTDPGGDPDEDGFDNLQEFQNGTSPVVAETTSATLPVFLLTGSGNARGLAGATPLRSPPPGSHPAEQSGGVWFHDGDGWSMLAAAGDDSFGPEIAFARLLWDAGLRNFGIVKSTAASGGNTLWEKGNSAYEALIATATSAAAAPPEGFDALSFRALLYVQGENNDAAEADAAGTRFAGLLDHLKTDLPNATSLQGILGEIGGNGAARDTTRARHASLAAARADIGLARATGIATHNLDGLGIHYDADGLFLLGARLAAEAFDLALADAPLPSWPQVHAWYVADHAAGFDANGAVVRWGTVRHGAAARDLSRRVSGETFRRPVTAGSGQVRYLMRFDGTNNLWSNATSEFGAISGARSVAILCRVTDGGDGFLFDGTTGTGKTRAQVRGGQWQAGVTPSTGSWDGAEPATVSRQTGVWQQHVFTFSPGGGGTTVSHWIDGIPAATVSDASTADLGGLILGSNGGTPFTRLGVDIAEVAVFSTALGESGVGQLKAAWDARWGVPTGPPFAARVSQTPREVARFGWHDTLEIEIDSASSGIVTLDALRIALSPGSRAAVSRWALKRNGAFLATIGEPGGDELLFSLSEPLAEGTNRFVLAAEPRRHAPLGSVFDARVLDLETSGTPGGAIVPENADPAGHLALALVPMLADVVKEGDEGIPHFRIPGIVIDGHGVLHAVYDHRYTNTGGFAGGNDLPANIDVGYSRSTDGGATWTPTRAIMDFDASAPGSQGNGVGDPCILYDPATDTLWAAALWSFGNRGYHGSGPGLLPSETAQYVLVKSGDGGETWSAPINITSQIKDSAWRLIFCGPGRGLALRDGTLVFPSQMRHANGAERVCHIFSRDHGETWQFGSVIPHSSPSTNENEFTELDDGRLLFSMRTPVGSNGQRAWSHFTPGAPDGGVDPLQSGAWSPIYRLPSVPDPVCQASVIQWTSRHRGHPREFVLFGNPASSSSRVNYTLRVSPDGGASWPVSRQLYAGSSGYSCLTVLPDRSIGVLFERDNFTKISFVRVEAEWLMNPGLDSDGDGMPDAWETLHGTHPAADDAAADPDGDGQSNLAEHLAGTDPLDPASALRATSFAPGDSGGSFGWQAVPGKAYLIETSADLVEWQPVLTVWADRPAMTADLPPSDGKPRLFVRAQVLR